MSRGFAVKKKKKKAEFALQRKSVKNLKIIFPMLGFSTSSVGRQKFEGGNGSLIVFSRSEAALCCCLHSLDPTAWKIRRNKPPVSWLSLGFLFMFFFVGGDKPKCEKYLAVYVKSSQSSEKPNWNSCHLFGVLFF